MRNNRSARTWRLAKSNELYIHQFLWLRWTKHCSYPRTVIASSNMYMMRCQSLYSFNRTTYS